jgi:hypothetical protein
MYRDHAREASSRVPDSEACGGPLHSNWHGYVCTASPLFVLGACGQRVSICVWRGSSGDVKPQGRRGRSAPSVVYLYEQRAMAPATVVQTMVAMMRPRAAHGVPAGKQREQRGNLAGDAGGLFGAARIAGCDRRRV